MAVNPSRLSVLICCLMVIVTPCISQRARILVDTITTMVDASTPPFNQAHAGDTIFFEHGKRDYLLIRNFHGEPGNPVVFMNFGGVVTIDTDHHYGISLQHCQYVKFTGTGTPDNFYGFNVMRVLDGAGIGIGDMSSDIEIDHFSISNVPIGGLYAKTDPDCSFNTTREKFTQYNTIIHDNFVSNAGNEGMYIGSSKYLGQIVTCNGVDTLLLPSLLKGVRIYNNIIQYSGWDGIQVSSASVDCQIYDNLILYDSQREYNAQMSGILIGGGSKCDCYNNYIAYGNGNGIESHGLGGYRIYNNIIVDAGKTFHPDDSTQMKHGIFVSDVSTQPDSSLYIMFNDIINPKSDGIRFSSTISRHNLIASNAIINPGNYDFYDHGNTGFKGVDAYVMIPEHTADVLVQQNYFTRDFDSAGFAASNFTLLPGSPLVDAGYADNKGITFDFYRHERPYGTGYDIGAHEFNPAYLGQPEAQPSNVSKIWLFPNPVRDSFSIRFQVPATSAVILEIYDLAGRQAGACNWGQLHPGLHTKKVSLQNMGEGIYLFNLRIGNKIQSGRFVKAGFR